ncbi:MAG: sensor histidine kinase, partial [Nitrospiraceae bacterium]
IEAGRVELNVGPVSIADLASEVVESFQTIARKKLITLQAHADRAIPSIQADRDKLHQVLTNLLQNAIKFTGHGGEIELDARLREDMVQVGVSDNGVGIHPDDVGKIFDSFYCGRGISTEAKGAGLGLSITKKLIELHGGSIWVESSLSEGSRFYFTLPLRRE